MLLLIQAVPLVDIRRVRGMSQSHLNETNIRALLPEALTADVQAVLPDETGFVGANSAVAKMSVTVHCPPFHSSSTKSQSYISSKSFKFIGFSLIEMFRTHHCLEPFP